MTSSNPSTTIYATHIHSLFYTTDGGGPPTALSASFSSGTAILPGGFGLYLPFSTTGVVNASRVIQSLSPDDTPIPAASVYSALVSNGTTGAIVNVSSYGAVTLNSRQVLYIPVVKHLPTVVRAESFITSLDHVLHVSTPTPFSGRPISSSQPGKSTDTATTTSTTGQQSPSPSHKGPKHSNGVSSGALAGGIIGGFLLGLILCGLAAFCLQRRRSNRAPVNSTPVDREEIFAGRHVREKQAPTAEVVDISGWQKHLPDPENDGPLGKSIKSIFDLIQVHVEGFYEPKSARVSSTDIEQVQAIVPDTLPSQLLQSNLSNTVLEAVLVRWVVHRISGRSSTSDSLLPSEFTTIAAMNRWHMEKDSGIDGSAAEHQRGFIQAFSQWRRLTGFLGPSSRSDLHSVLDTAVWNLTEALSPWEIPGKKEANRCHSLRKILVQASQQGVVLFKQPSSYLFDWSKHGERDETLVVTPALVKRLDESAKALPRMQVLINAKELKL